MGSLGSSVVIHWFGHIYMMQMVSFNIWFWFGFWWAFQSRIIPEIHLFYSDWTLCSMRRVWWDHWEVVLYFTDLDISLWCRWFLSISGCNSVSGAHFSPESFQRFIYFFRLDTLCLADVYVGIIGKRCCNSLIWTYLYDADGFFQYLILIRFLVLISVPKHSRESFILFRLDTLLYETCMMGSLGSSVVLHWFGHISMMQMVSFNFGL